MKAVTLVQRRIVVAADAFVDIVIWKVPERVASSSHDYKFRLAYVVGGECVLRYDNERGKGGHRHMGTRELPYRFTTPERLMADFEEDIARWNDEHGRS